jgi:enamine deaminase RidA (YjgF/YER057c/UK114 family)
MAPPRRSKRMILMTDPSTAFATVDTSPEARLRALGIELPRSPPPVANFVPYVREGSLLFLSGQGPMRADGYEPHGKVGRDFTTEQAYVHARMTGINLLAVMREALGSLDRVRRVVKLLGMVNAVPEFDAHPRVINGCSDLFLEVFGPERGRHARSAVGMGSLPAQITVEIEAVIAIDD